MSKDEVSSYLELTRQTPLRTLIHQLLNGYGAFREGELSGPWLVAALAELGHRPPAVRQMLRRMLRTGELESRRAGRENRFRLSEFSRAGAASAQRRLFAGESEAWDGRWTLALYQFRAEERGVREHVRVVLSLESFGSFSRGVFLHPRDRVRAVTRALAAVGLADHVRLYRAERCAGPSDADAAAQAWDLPAIARAYREFEACFRALRTDPLSARQAFVASSAVVATFLAASFRDPELPASLLPDDWPGFAAQRRVAQLLGGLQAGMLAHGDSLRPRRGDRP